MRQFILHHPIHISTQNGAQYYQYDDPVALSDEHIHRPGAAAGDGPAQPKGRACQQVARNAQLHRRIAHQIAGEGFDFQFFHGKNDTSAQNNRRTDDAVHVDALETEHLVDAKPGDGFRLGHDDAEENTDGKKCYIFHACESFWMGKLKQQGHNDVRHQQAADEKADHRDK